MIPVFAKMYKSRFEATAQIKPGISPHKAVTAIVITESRYRGNAIRPARRSPR